MNPPSAAADRPLLEVRDTRASSVIVHRVPPQFVERFLEWQRGITAAAQGFPGYLATDVYSATDAAHPQWVVVVHFDSPEALQRWVDAPARAEWTAKLPAEVADFQMKTLSTGFGPWFAGLVEGGGFPAHWKMILTVLLGLYPIVMLLTIFLSPYTVHWFGLSIALLIGNAISVIILEWGTPALSRVLGPWLRAGGKEGWALSVAGLAAILAALGVMAFLFRLAAG